MVERLIDFLGVENPLSALLKEVGKGRNYSDAMGICSCSYYGGVEQQTYSGTSVEMDFESYVSREDDRFWHAGLCISEIQEPDDPLVICVTDSKDEFIKTGIFSFLGSPFELHNGIVKSTLRHFRDNLTNTDVSLRRSEWKLSVPGRFVL